LEMGPGEHFSVNFTVLKKICWIEDLLDISIPYLKAGLENNEFCLWIVSEPLNMEKVKEALQKIEKNPHKRNSPPD